MMQFNPMYINVNGSAANAQPSDMTKLKSNKYLFADIIKVLMGNQEPVSDNNVNVNSGEIKIESGKLLGVSTKDISNNAQDLIFPLISVLPEALIEKLDSSIKANGNGEMISVVSDLNITSKELKSILGKEVKWKTVKNHFKKGAQLLVNIEDENNQLNLQISGKSIGKKVKYFADVSLIKNKQDIFSNTESIGKEFSEIKKTANNEIRQNALVNTGSDLKVTELKNNPSGKQLNSGQKVIVKTFLQQGQTVDSKSQYSESSVNKRVHVVVRSPENEKANILEVKPGVEKKHIVDLINSLGSKSQVDEIKKIEIINYQNKHVNYSGAKERDLQKDVNNVNKRTIRPNKIKIQNKSVIIKNGGSEIPQKELITEKFTGKDLFAKEYFKVKNNTTVPEKPVIKQSTLNKQNVENPVGTKNEKIENPPKITGKHFNVSQNKKSSIEEREISKPELKSNDGRKVQPLNEENKKVFNGAGSKSDTAAKSGVKTQPEVKVSEKPETNVNTQRGLTEGDRPEVKLDKPAVSANENKDSRFNNSEPNQNKSIKAEAQIEVGKAKKSDKPGEQRAKGKSVKVAETKLHYAKEKQSKQNLNSGQVVNKELETDGFENQTKNVSEQKGFEISEKIKKDEPKADLKIHKTGKKHVAKNPGENKPVEFNENKNTEHKTIARKPDVKNVHKSELQTLKPEHNNDASKTGENKNDKLVVENVNPRVESGVKEHSPKINLTGHDKSTKEVTQKSRPDFANQNDQPNNEGYDQPENQNKNNDHVNKNVKAHNAKAAFEHLTEKANSKMHNVDQSVDKSETPVKTIKYTEMFKEISKFIQKNDKTMMVLELEPKHLGKVNISLDSSNHTIKAHIQVDNPQAKQLLESNLDELFSNLGKDGIQLGSLDISLNNAGKQQDEHHENKRAKNFDADEIGNEVEQFSKTKYYGYNTYEYLA